MASQFQQPGISSPEDKFAPAENKGALLLFFPTGYQQGVKTAHGESDAITCRVVRLNDGRVYDNAMIFSTALITQLKSAVPDGMVLGTLDQGENTKGNPPWLLRPHTEADVAVAEQWLAANPRNQFQQAPQAAPAPAPAWGQTAHGNPAPAPTWSAPAPAAPPQNAWAAPAPAPAAAPQQVWGAPAPASAPASAPAWGAPAPAPAPAIDPGLVAFLTSKGVPPSAYQDQATAEQIAAVVAGQ